MNETERMNETNPVETATACGALAAGMSGTDRCHCPSGAPAEIVWNGNVDAVSESATVFPAAGAAESAILAGEAPEEDSPASLLDRLLDAVYTVWDAFLDLLVALHILEEALPEQSETRGTLPAAPISGSSTFSPESTREAAGRPIVVTPVPPPCCGLTGLEAHASFSPKGRFYNHRTPESLTTNLQKAGRHTLPRRVPVCL